MQPCPICRTELPDNATSCGKCGYDLSDPKTIKTAVVKLKVDAPITHKRAAVQSSSLQTERGNAVASRSRISSLSQRVSGRLPLPVQKLIAITLQRAGDPEPEGSPLAIHKIEKEQVLDLGWLPVLTLINVLGVFSVACAYISARNNLPWAESFFWLGLLLIFIPSTLRLLSPSVSRFERIALVCVVGICFYLVNVMDSPLYFSSFDEFLHWRTADDIARTGHLFSENAQLPVSPFYPGLEIVTDALSKMSGLSTFYAGIIVISAARLLTVLALFMLYEQFSHSARIAGIATLLYMTNPHFIFFDAQYAYESLALALATLMLFVVARQESMSRDRRRLTLVAWLILAAVIVTHHVTGFIFDGLLLLWTITYAFLNRMKVFRSNITKTALLAVFLSVIWVSLRDNPVVEYLSASFIGALNELGHILTGTSSARVLFSGQPTPLWERLIAAASVILIGLGLPFGLLCLWLRFRANALAWMLGIVALFYPVSHVFRFTKFGSEIADRSAAFLFIPLACVLAIFIAQFWSTQRLTWKWRTVLTGAIAVLLLGSFIIGNGPASTFLPGPYQVGADGYSIEPEGIQTGLWTLSFLGPNNRISTDRTNRMLLSTYGDQRMITTLDDRIDVTPVFFSSTFGPNEISLLHDAQVRYLAVDLRLSTGVPVLGFYFELGEPNTFQHTQPIERQALTKFNTVSQIDRIYDSGNIIIYDVGEMSNAPEKP
jgi:hypothetical protein